MQHTLPPPANTPCVPKSTSGFHRSPFGTFSVRVPSDLCQLETTGFKLGRVVKCSQQDKGTASGGGELAAPSPQLLPGLSRSRDTGGTGGVHRWTSGWIGGQSGLHMVRKSGRGRIYLSWLRHGTVEETITGRLSPLTHFRWEESPFLCSVSEPCLGVHTTCPRRGRPSLR